MPIQFTLNTSTGFRNKFENIDAKSQSLDINDTTGQASFDTSQDDALKTAEEILKLVEEFRTFGENEKIYKTKQAAANGLDNLQAKNKSGYTTQNFGNAFREIKSYYDTAKPLTELQAKLESLKTATDLSNAVEEVTALLEKVPNETEGDKADDRFNDQAWEALVTAYNTACSSGNTALAQALLDVLKPYTADDFDNEQQDKINTLNAQAEIDGLVGSSVDHSPSQAICTNLESYRTNYAPNDQDPDWNFYNTNWQNYCTTPPPPGGEAGGVTPEHGFDWGAVGAGGSASVLVTSLGLFLPRSYLVPLSLLEGALGGGLTALLNDNQQQVPVWHSIWQGAGSALLGHGIGFFTKNPLLNMLFTGIGMGAVSFGWEAARNNSIEGSIWDTIKQSASSTFTREAMASMFLSSMIGSVGGTMHNIRRQTPWHVGFRSPHTDFAERVYTHHRAIDRALLTGSELPGSALGTTTDPFQYTNTHDDLANVVSRSPSRSGYQAREAFNGPRDVKRAITEDLAVARKKLEAVQKRDLAVQHAGTDAEASSVAAALTAIDTLPLTSKEKAAAHKVLDDQVAQAREKVEAKRQQEAEEQAKRTRETQQKVGRAADAYLERASALIATSAEPKNMTLGQLVQHNENIAIESIHYQNEVRGDANTHLPDRVAELDDTLNGLIAKTQATGRHIHTLKRNLAHVTGLGETSPLTEVGALTSPDQVSEFLRSKGIARAVNDLASLDPDTAIHLTSPRLGGASSNSTPAQHLRDISRFLTEQMSTPEFAASPNARATRHAVRDEVLKYAGTNKDTVIAAGETHPLYRLATVDNTTGLTEAFPLNPARLDGHRETPPRVAALEDRNFQQVARGGPRVIKPSTEAPELTEAEQRVLDAHLAETPDPKSTHQVAEETFTPSDPEAESPNPAPSPPPGSLGNARLGGEPGPDSDRLGGQEPSPTIDDAYRSNYGEYNPRQIGTNDGRHAEILGRLVEEPRAQLEQAQARLVSARESHEQATSEARRLAREVQDLEAQTLELQARVTQAKHKVESAIADSDAIQEKISRPRGNIPTEKTYVDSYTTLLHEAKQAQITAEANLAQAKAEQGQAKKALTTARGKATRRQISNSDVNPFNERADAANAKVKDAERALAEAKASVEENRVGLEQSQANLARYTAELEALTPEFERASTARQQAFTQRDEATAALKANEAQVQSTRTGLNGAQRRARVAERELATAKSNVTNAQDRYNNAVEIRDNARKQLAGEIQGLEAEIRRIQDGTNLRNGVARGRSAMAAKLEHDSYNLNNDATLLESNAKQTLQRATELRQASDEAKTALAEARSNVEGKKGLHQLNANRRLETANENASRLDAESHQAESLAQTQREQAEAARRAANDAQEKALAARANAEAANRARDEALARLNALQADLTAIRNS